MFVTRKHIPRRTLLKGLGTAIALPWLDSMVPAFASPVDQKAPLRLAFAYVPNGMIMKHWTPTVVGKDFEITHIMEPLAAFREDMLVLTGLSHLKGEGVGGDHPRASATYLTGTGPGPKPASSAIIEVGVSVDQVAAQALGHKTRLPSLEMCFEGAPQVGLCDGGFNCAYLNNLSWRDSSTPVPPETNPRMVFERLYGTLDQDPDPQVQARVAGNRKSVLDFVDRQTQQLNARLAAADRRKLDEYFTSVRDIEKRIERAEGDNRELTPGMEKPSGIPAKFADHAALMGDLMAAAFQGDVTRIGTMLYAKEASSRAYPELGFSDAHHPLSHHGNKEESLEKLVKIEVHHMMQFARFIQKLKSIQEGDGTLLDHSMIVYGSAMSEPNAHFHYNIPIVILGRGNGALKPGRHVAYPVPQTPASNLWLALLDKMGVPTEKLGDSTGRVEGLTDI